MFTQRRQRRTSRKTRKDSPVREPPFICVGVYVCVHPAHKPITRSWCYEEGILCCDGEVTNVVSFDLPSQFIDAILPSYDQFSNTGNLDLFSSDIPLDDGSVQYSLLGGGTSDNLFASNEFTPSGDVVYQDQNDLVAVGANGGDVSWFQS